MSSSGETPWIQPGKYGENTEMNVFIDTSALFALLVSNDYMHVRAKGLFQLMLNHPIEFHITSYVLLETVALLQSRVGLDAARIFQHEFVPALNVNWVNQDLHEKAFRRLELRGKRDVSLVDYTSFVWMEENATTYVMAYDDHFKDEGFSILGHPDDFSRISTEN